MSFLDIHPDWQETLRRQGLAGAEDFLHLQGVILGGHPNRHVLRVALDRATGILKKEHRVSWRDRLGNWWRGHGAVSKARREGNMLRLLEAAGLDAPRALAFGEADGRAFLLLQEVADAVELRTYLLDHPLERMALAQALGAELARLHEAGFYHRDLYSKHILVARKEREWRFCFLDWQRGRRVRRLTWMQRLRDLATLDASLADALASHRERLLCWRSYLAAQTRLVTKPQKLLRVLCRLSACLQSKRRVREARQMPLPSGRQDLIWLDGEALCVTPRFQQMLPQMPDWLAMPERPSLGNCLQMVELPARESGRWRLLRRWSSRPWLWLASWWRRSQFPAPEFEQAAAIIRLERCGVDVPRLLALGHRTLRPWQKYSFLLTEVASDSLPLASYLRAALPDRRRQVLRHAGELLRRVHEAGYVWNGLGLDGWAVNPKTGSVLLTHVQGLRRATGSMDKLAQANLKLLAAVPGLDLSAADKMRFFLGYHGASRLTATGQRQARKLASRLRRPRSRRERQVA